VCASCHRQIDPAGFGLENFNGIGQYRTTYRNGDTIDASGSFEGGVPFNGAKELSQVLVENPRFRICYARNLMTFGLGRILSTTDKCSSDVMGSQKATPGSKFSDLLKSLVTSEQFLKQRGGN
jgi:hypothetical protein